MPKYIAQARLFELNADGSYHELTFEASTPFDADDADVARWQAAVKLGSLFSGVSHDRGPEGGRIDWPEHQT